MLRKPSSENQSTATRRTYYESDDGLKRLSSWYVDEKEKSFIDFLFDRLRLPSVGPIVEIGGGAGTHGRILAQRFGQRYLFTDLSRNFVESAKMSGLRAAQMDGLAMALSDSSVASVLLVSITTIVHDQETRQRQFRECARILQPDGVCLFVTPRWDRRYHLCNHDDAEFLQELGFSISWRSWGIIPGRLWHSRNKDVLNLLEKVAATTNLAARSILLARRHQ